MSCLDLSEEGTPQTLQKFDSLTPLSALQVHWPWVSQQGHRVSHSPVPALCRVCPNRLQRPPRVNLLLLLPKGSELRERTQGCVNLLLQGCPKRGGRGGGGVSRFELIFEFWNCFELF